MSYHGGINFEKWFNRVMTAPASEVSQIRKEFEDILKRQAETERQETEKVSRRIKNEKSIHPQVVIQNDYYS